MGTQPYHSARGEKLPSVTTVLNRFKESGGLMRWNYTQGREHGAHEMRYMAQLRIFALPIFASLSTSDEGIIETLLGPDWRKRLPPPPKDQYSKVKEAAEAGTIGHHLIERHILRGVGLEAGSEGLPQMCIDAEPEIKRRAVNAFNQYLEWRDQTRLEIIATEMPLVSDLYGFGGTLDAIGRDGKGRIVLLDWKTSNRVYADHMIQLGAYSLLLEEKRPDLAPQGYHLLRVAKENAAFAHFYHAEMDIEKRQFLRLVEAFKDDQLIQRRL